MWIVVQTWLHGLEEKVTNTKNVTGGRGKKYENLCDVINGRPFMVNSLDVKYQFLRKKAL